MRKGACAAAATSLNARRAAAAAGPSGLPLAQRSSSQPRRKRRRRSCAFLARSAPRLDLARPRFIPQDLPASRRENTERGQAHTRRLGKGRAWARASGSCSSNKLELCSGPKRVPITLDSSGKMSG